MKKLLLLLVIWLNCNVAIAATRYYLPITGTAAVSPAIDADWQFDDTATTRRPLVTTKSNTALTDVIDSVDTVGHGLEGTGKYFIRQYVSPQIGVFNFNGTTASMVLRCKTTLAGTTTKLRVNFKLYHADTTLTTLLAGADYDTNFGTTAATRIVNAAALGNITSTNNDRILVEVGFNVSAVSASGDITLRFGDPSATGDFALTTALTTDLDPWVEFSGTIPAPGGATDTGKFFHMFGLLLKPSWFWHF